MEMFILVLNKTEYLSDILSEMKENGYNGATVLDCKGMLKELDSYDVDAPALGLLRHYNAPERSRCKMVMTAIREEQRDHLTSIINRKTGGMDKVDAGIMFSVPMTRIWGITQRK